MPKAISPTSPADKSTKPSPESPNDSGAYTRLHISPLDPELLKVVVSASVLPKARGISYHSLETFPERRFGYVELPEADAEKLRKKLNGAILKGHKMRVDKARSETRAADPEFDAAAADEKRKKKSKKADKKKAGDEDESVKSKKRKRDHNVLDGVELEDGRKVKRGWTVTDEDKIKEKRKSKKDKEKDKDKDKKDKKKKKREERSKYTDREECLVKTRLPAKSEAAADDDEDKADRKKRKKGKGRDVVIHEFANTTKFPSFLKSNKPSADHTMSNLEYVEGKGWVDEDGTVVEAIKATRPTEVARTARAEKKPKLAPVTTADDDETSSSGSSSEDDDDQPVLSKQTAPAKTSATVTPVKVKSPNKAQQQQQQQQQPAIDDEDDETSSSGSSSDDEENQAVEDDTSSDESEAQNTTPARILVTSPPSGDQPDSARPKSSGSNMSLTIQIPPMTPAKVHPLEALYKKRTDGATPANEGQPFSFFGNSDDIDEGDDGQGPSALLATPGQLPMTPFTQEEFDWRHTRSAAPTPDTAHPTRMRNFWAGDNMDEEDAIEEEAEDEEEEENAEMTAAGQDAGEGGSSGAPAGGFQKWFWDNRRELNRSWMKRRKTAAKEKRHRDNKSRASKAI